MSGRRDPTASDQFQVLLRSDLGFFLERVFATVSPADRFLPNWHIDAIVHHLGLVISGKIKRLIITIPPRYLKSIAASVALPAFVLGRDPTAQIVNVSYAQDLATKHAHDTRVVMLEPWYRRAFPLTRIDKCTEVELTTTARGFRLATSVGGVLTGRGGNIIIVDDPIKPQDAMSDTARVKALDWLENTLFTRLNDKVNGAIIIVMQRLHEDDPVGHLLAKGGWIHLNLPAIAEIRTEIPIGPGRFYVRQPGELLHAEREPQAALDRMKIDLGSAMFSAQYQQAPVPPEGNLIKPEWFKSYGTSPPYWEEGDVFFVSWDTAQKANDLNDFSVGTVWLLKSKKRELYLFDLVRGKFDYPTLRERVIAVHHRSYASFSLIEDKGSGTALLQDLRRRSDWKDPISVRAMMPVGDKIMRMATVSPIIEEGRVFLPERAPWLDAFLSEVAAFPRGRHDDQVDSLSQALEYVRTRHLREVHVRFVKGLY